MGISEKTLKHILVVTVTCLLGLTGCIRLDDEMDLLSRGRSHYPPPARFYSGTKWCTGFMVYYWPFAPFFLLDLPLELVADTLCLPHDIWLYHDYKQNPPLALLVKEKRYDELEKRLKAGENPNKNDWRMFDHSSPTQQAIHALDVKAYSLLLEYGAVPNETPFANRLLTKENKEIIRMTLQKCSVQNDDIIFHWCNNLFTSSRKLSPSEQQFFVDIIEMMVNHGFPPQSPSSFSVPRKTAMDMVYDDKTVLSRENRQRLINILKAHGGKTYVELTQTDKSLPHLHTENLEIHPVFNQIIGQLQKSWQSERYRLSTHYDGIDEPVLVIDLPWPTVDGAEPRKTIFVHRRISTTEWNQEGELFDVPTGWRIVATPRGKRMPSRLSSDMPRLFLRESWMTLPECEVYLECPGEIFSGVQALLPETLRLDKTSNTLEILPRPYDVRSEARFMHSNMEKWTAALTKTDEKWLSSLNKATSSAGFPGQWSRCLLDHDMTNPIYVYDVNGRFARKTDEHPVIVPKPDEIICVFVPYRLLDKSDKRNGRSWIWMNSKDGYSYWNYRKFFVSGFAIYVFFGDEVSNAILDQMQATLETIMKKH